MMMIPNVDDGELNINVLINKHNNNNNDTNINGIQ